MRWETGGYKHSSSSHRPLNADNCLYHAYHRRPHPSSTHIRQDLAPLVNTQSARNSPVSHHFLIGALAYFSVGCFLLSARHTTRAILTPLFTTQPDTPIFITPPARCDPCPWSHRGFPRLEQRGPIVQIGVGERIQISGCRLELRTERCQPLCRLFALLALSLAGLCKCKRGCRKEKNRSGRVGEWRANA